MYEYFTNLMKARVWRDESDDLFKKLKVHVQVFMNQLAARLFLFRCAQCLADVMQHVAACCSLLQHVAACCSELL